jgi:hypothetical protein
MIDKSYNNQSCWGFMIRKKLQIFTILCLIFTGIQANDQLNSIEQGYQTTFSFFSKINKAAKDVQISLTPQFFLQFNLSFKEIIKKLNKDIKTVTQEIKTLKRQKIACPSLVAVKTKLSNIRSFLKKHRLQYEIVLFHKSIKDKWGILFKELSTDKDISTMLRDVEIEHEGVEGLKILLAKVEKDLRTVENYDYRLHTDWIDTKLANYVLKIELIRLRNAILFHPLYKKTKLKLHSSYPR